jgi:hypothetical protein
MEPEEMAVAQKDRFLYHRRGSSISKHRIKIVVMDLEETETRNDSAGEDQQQLNRSTRRIQSWLGSRECEDIWSHVLL